ncbi:MAG: sigma-70 family RNA polymerase sigma factor [Tuberibacillus sp.]
MNPLPEFENVIRMYEPLIKKFLNKYGLVSDFDEYRQIAWIALWEAYKNFNPQKGPFPAYASAMIRGRLLTEIKRRRSYVHKHELTDRIHENGKMEEATPPEVDIPLSILSSREKQWIRAAVFEEMSTKEIASRFGVTQDTVRSWKKSALKKLKEQLSGQA